MGYNPVDSNGNPNDVAAQWMRDTAAALNGGGAGFPNTQVVQKAITYTGAAGKGAVGTVSLFTVTGEVLLAIIGICGTTLVGTSATIAVGNSGSTAKYLPSKTATTVVAGGTEDITGFVSAGTTPVTTPNQAAGTTSPETVIATVGTANITAGEVTYYAFYKPLSAGATVTAN